MKKMLFLSACAIVAAYGAAPSAYATDSPTAKRVLVADDYYNTQTLTEPQTSPDGKWVAYVLSTNDRDSDESRSALWMVSWDGAEQVPLTNPAHETSTPRWSPDGRYLAYVASPPCTEKSQIMILDRRGGEARALTNVNDDIQGYEWSPDGKRLALVMDKGLPKTPVAGTSAISVDLSSELNGKPLDAAKCVVTPELPKPIVIDTLHFKEDKYGYLGSGRERHLYLLDIASRKIEPLTSDPAFNDSLPVWSPDGKRIAFVRTREKAPDGDGKEDIDLIDARPSAAAEHLARIFVPNQQKLAWSPDGARLVYLQGAEPKYNQYTQDRLAVASLTAAAEFHTLTQALDRAVGSYAFGKDAASVIATIEDDTTAYAALINLRNGTINKLAQGPFVVSDVTSGGGHTSLLYADDGAPAEVYALDDKRLRKLTKHNDAFIAGLQLGKVEDLRFNSADGTPIHGLMVKPPTFEPTRRYPLLLYIHGGPNLQDSHSLAFDDYQFKRQLLAASGYVVIGINYRGSAGRGDAFSRAIAADWGHKEVEDLLAGVDYVVQSGAVDPERLGIGGWSYGGMLTDYSIASTGRFKAAVSGAGTANPLALYGADQYNLQYGAELGEPWRNTDLYLKLAYPFLHADRIHTPTLFMGGGKDFNVPLVGGEQMYLALRTLGVPAQLVVYPGEFHTLTRPSFLKDRLERMLAWYGQYLTH